MKRLPFLIPLIFLFNVSYSQDSLETDSSDTTTEELSAPDLFEKSAKFKNFTVGMTGVGIVGITSFAVSDYGGILTKKVNNCKIHQKLVKNATDYFQEKKRQ